MGAAVALYAVVDRNGTLRRRKGGLLIYDKLSTAQRQASRAGDSVVELVLNLDREPLFIRGDS
jgi:hypothetical protein